MAQIEEILRGSEIAIRCSIVGELFRIVDGICGSAVSTPGVAHREISWTSYEEEEGEGEGVTRSLTMAGKKLFVSID